MALESLAAQNAAPRPPVLHPGAVQGGAASKAEATGEDQDMSFWDVLDIVNPLQHIPLVNSVYRAVTGDEIKPAMQIGGGILFGGVIGGVAAIANAALQEATGKDLGGHMMATLGFGDDAPPAGQAAQLAAAPQPAPRPAQASGSQAQPAQTQRQPSPQLQQQMQQQQLQQQAMAAANAGAGAMGVPGMGAGGMGPPGALSAGLSAAAGARPQGMDPNLVMNSGHTPAKMPKRDAMLASAMPRGSATSNLDRAPSVDRTGPTLPQNRGAANPQAGQAAVQPTSANPVSANSAATNPAATNPAATNPAAANPAANQAAPAGRDAMAEIMMRNLAKYQAEKRAQNHTIRTSG